VYEKTRMLEASNNGYAILNTNDKIDIISNQNGEFCREINIMDVINDVDVIINLGKFRCEKNLGLIGCSQNLFGLVPGGLKDLVKSRCHTLNSYYNYIIDLNEALEDKVVLSILDGIVGCEANGDPRILNSIIIGQSQYAVDYVALQIINQNPREYLLFNECERRGKFDFDCDITGDKISSVLCEDFKYSKFLGNIKSGSNGKFKREYNAIQKRPIISAKQCKGCKVCSNSCPMQAINIQSNQLGETAVINREKCINCLKCVDNCPYKIIKVKTPCKHYHIERMIKKHSKTNKGINE
jgi:NAD-dependent dihydropyrimidine dehydrogenase PreA subunit